MSTVSCILALSSYSQQLPPSPPAADSTDALLCLLQIERISQLEAQRETLLAQLPADLQLKVIRRQKEAATEEGEEAG